MRRATRLVHSFPSITSQLGPPPLPPLEQLHNVGTAEEARLEEEGEGDGPCRFLWLRLPLNHVQAGFTQQRTLLDMFPSRQKELTNVIVLDSSPEAETSPPFVEPLPAANVLNDDDHTTNVACANDVCEHNLFEVFYLSLSIVNQSDRALRGLHRWIIPCHHSTDLKHHQFTQHSWKIPPPSRSLDRPALTLTLFEKWKE